MNAIDLIKKFEGCRLNAYQDQGGVWTVGYGATGPNIGPTTVWTQQQADGDLEYRVKRIGDKLDGMVTRLLSPEQKVALTSFIYNVGDAAFYRSTCRGLINAGDFKGAADALLSWNHCGGKVNKGLTNRREAERALFLEGTTCS